MMDYFYILLTVAAASLCFKGPRWGIAALAFILPLSKRLPSLPIPLLNTQNLLVLAALLAIMVRRKKDRLASARYTVPLLVYAGLATMAYANTMLFFTPGRFFFMWNPYAITITFKNFLTCLLIYILGCVVAATREDLLLVLKGLLAGMGFEAAFVCAEIVLHGPARANGHLFEGNSAGAYLVGSFAAAAALCLVLKLKDRLGLVSLATAIASAIGLIFTMSRGNWISGVVAGGALTLIRDRRMLVLLVLGLMAYPLWLPQKALDRIDESFTTADQQPWRYRFREGTTEEMRSIGGLQSRLLGSQEDSESESRLDSSSQVRLYVWNAALGIISDYPLGVGYGVFPFYIGYYTEVVKFRAAHNSYLLITCELGIPGLLSLLLFMGCLLYEAVMAYREATEPLFKGLALAAIGVWVGMMASAFFYNFFFIIEVNGQQWLFLGLATQLRRLGRQAAAATQPAAVESREAVPLYRLVT